MSGFDLFLMICMKIFHVLGYLMLPLGVACWIYVIVMIAKAAKMATKEWLDALSAIDALSNSTPMMDAYRTRDNGISNQNANRDVDYVKRWWGEE